MIPSHPIIGKFLTNTGPVNGISIGAPITIGDYDPLTTNPVFYVDASSSMLGALEAPALDLDPSNPSSLDIITATRAGTATYTDLSGNIQLAAENTVRVDHVQGEELTPRTDQLVPYTDFSSGWSGGEVVSGYDSSVGFYLEADNAFDFASINIPVTSGETYRLSFWAKTSTITGISYIYHGFVTTNQNPIFGLTSEWQYFEVDITSDFTGDMRFGTRLQNAGDNITISKPSIRTIGLDNPVFISNTTGSLKTVSATYAPRVPMMLIEPAATNLITNTDFSDWTSSDVSVTDGAGYKGQTSKIITRTAGSSQSLFYDRFDAGYTFSTEHTGSFWIRKVAGTNTQINIDFYRASTSQSSSINLTEEWQKVEIVITSPSNAWFRFGLYFSPSVTSVGDSVEIAMPQVEEGTVATSYIPTATSTTNLLENSEVFSGSFFIKDSGVSVATTNHTSPTGSGLATKIEVTDSGRIYANFTSATYTTSLYLKSGTFSHFKIAGNILDLQSQTFAGGTIEFVGDGWYRISHTHTGTRPFQIQAYPDANYSTHTDSGDYYVWGAQVETGSVATPYSPTSTGERNSDDLVIDGTDFTDFYNTDEGTIYVEYEPRVLGTTTTALEFSDGSADNRIYSLVSSAFHCYIKDGGVAQAFLDGGTNTVGVLNRLAFSYEANNIQASLDGGAVVNDTSASIPTVDRLILGNQTVANTRLLNGHIKRVIYWPLHSDSL